MTKPEAHNFLNMARAGGRATSRQITEALAVTGDLGRAPVPVAVASVEASREWPYYANRAPALAALGAPA